MHILIVLENYYPHIGGVEVLFQTLAEGLVKQGHKVSIVTHKLKGSVDFEILNGVEIHRVRCLDSRYLFTFLSIPKVFRLARKADIIHTTTFNGAPPAWLVSRILRKPCLITVHEVWIGKWTELTDLPKWSAKIHNLLERAILSLRFNAYATVSNSTKKQLINIGVPEEKVKTVYNGLDYSRFNSKRLDRLASRKKLGLKAEDFVCLSFGRLGPSKGIKYAIKAMLPLAKKLPNLKYLLILSGDKQYKKKTNLLAEIIRKSKFKDKIKMLNPVAWEKIPNYIYAADCVIVPSLAEGFGYTVAESCAVGVPVVASNTTSIPEVISGKYLLVSPRDPNAIANAILKVKSKMYKQKKLKKFEWTKTIHNYLKIYNSQLNKDRLHQ